MAKNDEPRQRVADLKQGKYTDGSPHDDVHYLECKLILKPDRFTSRKSFWDYAKIVQKAAKQNDIGFSCEGFEDEQPQIREVIFLDTADCRLYKNAFILRRRIRYQDGFPVGEPEIVFKFRHPDMQKATEVDVRPRIAVDYRIKFKAEALPLKDSLGSFRMLFSHNVQFPLSHVHAAERASMSTLSQALPPLAAVKASDDEKVGLVSHTIVEEVLQDIGMLDSRPSRRLWRWPRACRSTRGRAAWRSVSAASRRYSWAVRWRWPSPSPSRRLAAPSRLGGRPSQALRPRRNAR